ncbi:hypothetical protein OESDEN_14286 [Oesophagostomum dentatum]|uniref:glucuronosyltransferase n=1 Tax=Oesophagostomum dentatum TaxID=61180 RepID=A0A0B1SQ04_OESDE|nr:hypothetical protein OESDEN_14286 [Oesophagostomum dentatum]
MISGLTIQTSMLVNTCRETLKQQEFLKWLEGEHFDLAFASVFDVCSVGLIHAAKIPGWIWLSSGAIMDHISYLTGIPIIRSYVPPLMMEAVGDMSFAQRVKSVIGHGLTKLLWTKLIAEPQMELFRTHVSPDFPDLLELASRCPLIMANTNDFYEIPRPTLAKVVNIGGIGVVSNAKPLPENMEKLLERAEGAVLFSFGSFAPAHRMPSEWKKIFSNTFRRFPNYQFFMRYEGNDVKGKQIYSISSIIWLK